MTSHDRPSDQSKGRRALIISVIMSLVIFYPLILEENSVAIESEKDSKSLTGVVDPWDDGGQPWPQPGRTPGRMSSSPAHGPVGGVGSLSSIIDPVINWEYGSYDLGTDSLGTPIGDFSGSLQVDSESNERCGGSSLYTVIIQTEASSGDSYLRIIEGEDSDLAWEVNLGQTETIKASPMIVDIDGSGGPEIIVVYDVIVGSDVTLKVDAWSPILVCDVTGWSSGGSHESQLLWNWEDPDLMISSEQGPYTGSIWGSHKPTSQPLLADLDLDGDAELVMSAIRESDNSPQVVAINLPSSGSPTKIWDKSLRYGSHGSDPVFVQTDDNTAYVMLTTTESTNGAMWLWKLDSSSGDPSWDGKSLGNLDGDSNVPHIRLPGPVVANLDQDSSPEIIVTIPTDGDSSGNLDGAEYRGLEVANGSEIWTYRSPNGYADSPPLPIDTDGDGDHDRMCWITWWQTTTARHGITGCVDDTDTSSPNEAWYRDLEQSSGTPNDEIAVSQPIWMDIDGTDEPELLVAYGRSLWGFDGSQGTSSAIGTDWADDLELNQRTWSSPSLADIDGDNTLDMVIGSTVVSLESPDIRPLLDGRGIEFDPTSPNPGQNVQISAFIENSGTGNTDSDIDAVLYADGVEIGRERFSSMQPVSPSGSGSFESFSVEWSGPLGDHEFTLEIDPFSNLTQTRDDNDVFSKMLSIIPTYNVTFEISSEPLRVSPGEAIEASPVVRSTGRLSGAWSLEIDGTQLPSGWTWEDITPGGSSNVQIVTGESWSPLIEIVAPSTAMGSDSGFLGLTMSLDSDSNVSVSSILPIEANRTRGLSIRGPEGASYSSGYGLIGDSARAWIVVENIGNALENQISLDWGNTLWGSDLRLIDEGGNERFALVLDPGERLVLEAYLDVPLVDENQQTVSIGDYVETALTLCVDGNEACQTVDLTFIALGVISRSHIRSVPSNGLEWIVEANGPVEENLLSWSLSSAGMAKTGWSWTASGDLSINGDNLSMNISSGSGVGILSLDLPNNAAPAFHYFEDNSEESVSHSLRLSLEILQIFRSSMVITSPNDQPFLVEVDDESLVVLRLENPGNGDDSFSLDFSVVLDENITEDPGVDVSFSRELVSLSAGSLTTVPVTVLLPENTPARVPLKVSFTMQSEGDSNAFSTVEIIFEARQDHQWNIYPFLPSESGDIYADGQTFQANPGESISLDVLVTNVGNLIDDLTLVTSVTTSLETGDSSSEWASSGSTISSLGVNETGTIKVNTSIPLDAWSGSSVDVMVTALAQGQEITTFSFSVVSGHVPSWNAVIDQANLEVDPRGSEITLSVLQMGNSPSRPYISMFVSGEQGWEIGNISEMPTINPGNSAPLLLNITPPSNAVHGRAVELTLRIKEGDSSGLSEIVFPLRVAVTHDFSLSGQGDWVVSQDGGYPLGYIENRGNAPSTISIQILSLPLGWEISGDQYVILGVGEISGIPIELLPDESWDGDVKTIRILAEDSEGNQREISMDTRMESYSWSTSPVIISTSGDSYVLGVHRTGSESTVIDSENGLLQWSDAGGWLWGSGAGGNGSVNVNSSTILEYRSWVSEPSFRQASCSVGGSVNSVEASCTILNGSDKFAYTLILSDDRGNMLDSVSGLLEAEESSGMINLSADDWDPLPGRSELTIRVIDSRGIEFSSDSNIFEVRRTDWNVGLVGLEIVGTGQDQEISILTKRENHQILDGSICLVDIEAGAFTAEYIVDMSESSALAPRPTIDRPDVKDGVELVAKISCGFPWDIDSNPSDDEARIILSGSDESDGGFSDSSTALASASLVIGISIAFAWMARNFREGREMMEKTRQAVEKKALERKANMAKDVQAVNDKTNKEEEISELSEEVPARASEEVPTEDKESLLDSFEQRLNRLRSEK